MLLAFAIRSALALISSRSGSTNLDIAAGSSSEADYQVLLAHDLGYMTPEDYRSLNAQVNEVKRMLNSYIKTLRANC